MPIAAVAGLSRKVLLMGLLFGVTPPVAAASPKTDGLKSTGPHCRVSIDHPEWRSVWLGHFSGGNLSRRSAHYRHLDWQDRYVCFASRASCDGWLRSMRRAYRNIEGYRACVPIRSGPLQIDAGRFPPAAPMSID